MSLWSRLRGAWTALSSSPPPLLPPPSAEPSLYPEGDVRNDIQKAMDLTPRRSRVERPRAEHLPPFMAPTEAGGRGPRKPLGLSPDFLRMLAKMNVWASSVINIRKREVAGCVWEIVPRLDDERKELDLLSALIQGAKRFPDRAAKLAEWSPSYLTREMVQDLLNACMPATVTTAEARYRFDLAFRDMVAVAESHAAAPRRLLENPNPDFAWADILAAITEDILVLNAGCIELRRALYPLDPKWSIEGRSIPKKSNPILALAWVDGATVRPVLDRTGQLYDSEDPDAPAFEQWLGSERVEQGGWKKHELVRIVEAPQTDVTWRGYACSRMETLARTLILDLRVDEADFEELRREFYGGFLAFKDKQFEDLEEMRDWLRNEVEGRKTLPLIGGEATFISASPDGSNRDKRSEARRNHYLDRVCAIFEIGRTKLGNYENANYSTSETSTEMTDDGLRNLLAPIDRAVTEQIVWAFGHKDIKYVSLPASGRDEEKRLALAKQKMDLGIWTVNDARLAFGKEPDDSGDRSLTYFTEYQKALGMTEGQGAGMGTSAAPEEGEEAENLEADADGDGVPDAEDADPNDPTVGAAEESEESEVTKSISVSPYAGWDWIPIPGVDD